MFTTNFTSRYLNHVHVKLRDTWEKNNTDKLFKKKYIQTITHGLKRERNRVRSDFIKFTFQNEMRCSSRKRSFAYLVVRCLYWRTQAFVFSMNGSNSGANEWNIMTRDTLFSCPTMKLSELNGRMNVDDDDDNRHKSTIEFKLKVMAFATMES